ncbi:MAG TPA: hypothetical protein VFE33_28485 [Thermoanaerobaculia bacterium]|nr:hypothetical protein [Thermoanaerobaculia bacterium]
MSQPSTPSPTVVPWLGSRTALVLAVLVPAVVLCLLTWVLPKEGFWISDDGNRYVQVQSFARQVPPEIAYPARDIDPALRFFPWDNHHFQRVGGRVVSFYLPYFAVLSLPAYRLAGPAGVYLLPLAAALALFVLFPLLLQEVGLGAWRAPATLGLGFCTPLVFYGLTFWEHSLAVLLAFLATLCLLRSGRSEGGRATTLALAAGVCLGLSTLLREEGYVLFAALFAASFWAFRTQRVRRPIVFAAGGLAVLVPLWGLQAHLYGSPFGIHAAVYTDLTNRTGLATIAAELGDLAYFLFGSHPVPWVSAALAVPSVLVLLAGLRKRERIGRLDLALLALGTLAAVVFVVLLVGDPNGVFDTIFSQGLLPQTPFLLIVLLGLRAELTSPEPPARFLAAACILFALLVGIPLNRGDVGIIWGPRHFLALFPLLVPLSLLALRDLWSRTAGLGSRRVLAALAAVLVVLGLALESRGLFLLARKREGTAKILDAVRRNSTDVVITDAFWLTEEAAGLYFQRKMLLIHSDADYRSVLDLLRSRGYTTATLVLFSGRPQLSPVALADVHRRATADRQVLIPGLEFQELEVVPVRLR